MGSRAALRSLFLKVLDLEPGQRAGFLNDPSISPETRAELDALLQADQGAETFFKNTVASERPVGLGIGERFGPFETRELLGRGGMGTVFRAERVDGELAQTVAIKLVERGWLDPRALERFRQERQILAGLVHPNIARLLDGGTRSDGVAYLVMEFVDGLSLDSYCDQLALSILDRLRLFLPLCEAVDYAHQKLIVHRDLKPSNVLVASDGQPKLLDFGIAKALDATASGEMRTLVLTPGFASPEQARGEEATTAADVYGLGSVLYFLLTGRPPHAVEGLSPAELQRAICEVPPERPSALRPELKGDLENILLKALHADPQRRYRSARELLEDIENYLSRRPVRATPDGWGYRAKKFVQRHAVASAAGTLALLAVIGGTVVSLYEAHRAEQRFAQVRELSNKFVFDFEASIRDTPGTLEARRMVASTARENLASLSAEAGSDPALRRELAESYYRLSQVESAAREFDLWLQHLEKSAALLHDLTDDCCGAPAQRVLYLDDLSDMVHYWIDRDAKKAMPIANESLRLAKLFYQQSPHDVLAEKAMIESLFIVGDAQMNVGEMRAGRDSLIESARRADELRKRLPDDEELAWRRAVIGNQLTGAYNLLGELEEARAAEAVSTGILDPLIAKHPANMRWRNQRIKMAASEAAILRKLSLKDPSLRPLVLPAVFATYKMARENSDRNPGDRLSLDLAEVMTSRYATQLERENKHQESLKVLDEETALLDVLGQRDPNDHRLLYLRASNWVSKGTVLTSLRQWREAQAALDTARKLLEPIRAKWPDDFTSLDLEVGALAHQSLVERHLGHPEVARESCRLGFEVALQAMTVNKDSKKPVAEIDMLRSEARILGLPDTTLGVAKTR